MPVQFFDHPVAIHPTVFFGVVEDVNLPEREQKFANDRVAHRDE